MPDPLRPRAALRTAVVWNVLRAALEERSTALGRPVLDVLDTGGGTGHFAVPAAGLGHRVTVVDPSPNALFALERRAAEAGVAERVQGVQGDVHGLFDVVAADSFDVVLCHGVLEYVDDPAQGLGNATRALREGGVLSLLAAGSGGAALAQGLAGHFKEARSALTDADGRWGEGDPVPRRFRPEGLRELAEGAGVEVRATHGVRVFSDLVPGALVDGEPGALEALLRLEETVAELPDLLALASQLHVYGVKRGPAPA